MYLFTFVLFFLLNIGSIDEDFCIQKSSLDKNPIYTFELIMDNVVQNDNSINSKNLASTGQDNYHNNSFGTVMIVTMIIALIFIGYSLIMLIKASRKNKLLLKELEDKNARLENVLSEKDKILEKNIRNMEDLSNYKTELEYQNQELAKSQYDMEILKNQYYEIYNFAPIAYFTLDEKFKILDANEKAEEIFNKSRKVLTGDYFFEYFDNDSKSAFHFFKESITDDTIKSKEIVIRSGNELKNTSMNFKMFFDENLKKRIIYAVCSDITQKKKLENELLELYRDLDELVAQRTISLQKTIEEKQKTENELKEKEQFIVNFTKKLPVGIYRTTPEGKVLFANERLTQILGFDSLDDFKNSFVNDLFVHKEARNRLIESLNRGKTTFESKMKKKNGEIIWVRDTSSIEYDYSGNIQYFDGILEDITDKKIADDNLKEAFHQLQDTKEKLEEANRLKAIILGNLGHELRTPLNGILGFTQLLIEDTKDDDTKEMLDMIYESASRLHKTLNSLLSITELESNYSNVNYDFIEVDLLIDSILNQFTATIQIIPLELNLDIDQNNKIAYSDEFLLTQIIFNIIDNAVKFTQKGSIGINLHSSSENSDYLLLEIIDTGIGISKDKIDNIFEAFRQESEGRDRKFEGIGIGLTITKKIADMLDCKIDIESEINKGTKVSVLIPANQTISNKEGALQINE
jgi:PAS domain S-box-containing protein